MSALRAAFGLILLVSACRQATPAEALSLAPSGLHRLTAIQYRNTVRDLFAQVPALRLPAALEPDTSPGGFTAIGATVDPLSARGVEQYEAAALDLVDQIFTDAALRSSLVGCEPTDACVGTYLHALLRRAWRRPVAASEVADYVALEHTVANEEGDPWAGLAAATSAILQSTQFLYRVELGEPELGRLGRPGIRRYRGNEVASRLSYFLWASMPDDVLLDAAEAGELDSVQGIRSQAARLLQSPRARGGLGQFFGELLSLDALATIAKASPDFTPALAASMREELERVVQDVVFTRDSDLRQLLDTRATFVDGALAQLYGLPPPSAEGFEPTSFPESGPRAGLLGLAGTLAIFSRVSTSSPTLRGRFIRERLLCESIAPPPPGVDRSLPVSSPACAACHSRMDPLGRPLERFDAIGAERPGPLARIDHPEGGITAWCSADN
jgi:hypothetical protein